MKPSFFNHFPPSKNPAHEVSDRYSLHPGCLGSVTSCFCVSLGEAEIGVRTPPRRWWGSTFFLYFDFFSFRGCPTIWVERFSKSVTHRFTRRGHLVPRWRYGDSYVLIVSNISVKRNPEIMWPVINWCSFFSLPDGWLNNFWINVYESYVKRRKVMHIFTYICRFCSKITSNIDSNIK